MSKKNSNFAVVFVRARSSRSAIETNRTRLASWKRSIPPLSPLTHKVRGDPLGTKDGFA